ncbi:hypothetical protein GQ600_23855 [Phytophthora cactorum]|nr:hypothetical protein GQ600_23855 [Phytophthora cactorum]
MKRPPLVIHLENNRGEDVIVGDAIDVTVRDRRNTYPNGLKVEVLDDINAGLSITKAARLHAIKSRMLCMYG